jgi:hypothetical protein
MALENGSFLIGAFTLTPILLSMPAPNQGGWSGGGWTGRDQFCPLQERVNDFFGIKQHIKDASTPNP